MQLQCELTVRLRMQAAELVGQSAERLRLARAALCRQAPLKLRSPTDLLQTLRLLGTWSGETGLLFSPPSVSARLALQKWQMLAAGLPLVWKQNGSTAYTC